MENVIRQVRQDMFKEEHPRYFLFITGVPSLEFDVQTPKYTAHFEKVCEGVFMTYCRGSVTVIGQSIEKMLDRSDFFITELAYTPMEI